MESKALYPLNIDKDFKNLIRPLQKNEYLQLEANLLADGCRDPIITWKLHGFALINLADAISQRKHENF
jgi:hypothetical protein